VLKLAFKRFWWGQYGGDEDGVCGDGEGIGIK